MMICEVCRKKQSGMINSYPLNDAHKDIQICANCQEKLEKIRYAQNADDVRQNTTEFLQSIPLGELPPFIRDQLKQEVNKYADSNIIEPFFAVRTQPIHSAVPSSKPASSLVTCPACKHSVPADYKMCPNCGKSLIEKPMISSNGAKIFTWALFVLLLVAGVAIGAAGTYVYDTESFLGDGYVWTFNFTGMLYLWGAAIIEVFIGAVFSSILHHLERLK